MNCEFRNSISFEFKEDHIEAVKCCAKRTFKGMKSYTIEEFESLDIIQEIRSFKGVSDGLENLEEVFKKFKYPSKVCNDERICFFPNEEISSVQLNLQTGCNARCIFCCENYGRDVKEWGGFHSVENFKKSKELYFNTLYKLKGAHLNVIKLTEVGEPLLYLPEIKEYFRSLTLEDTKQVTFVTNGHNFDDELIEIIKNSEVSFYILISVNASSSRVRKNVMGLDDFGHIYSISKRLKEIQKETSRVNPCLLYTICNENKEDFEVFKDIFNEFTVYPAFAN